MSFIWRMVISFLFGKIKDEVVIRGKVKKGEDAANDARDRDPDSVVRSNDGRWM